MRPLKIYECLQAAVTKSICEEKFPEMLKKMQNLLTGDFFVGSEVKTIVEVFVLSQ